MYIGEGHLTDDDAERFANGEMDDVEMPEADMHQAGCDDCHNLVNAKAELAHAREQAAAARMGEQRSDLDYFEAAGYAGGEFFEEDGDRKLRDEVRREERDDEEDLRRDD